MSLELCILASGSGGNCTLVRTPAGILLIDAGLGPISASQRLDGTGIHVRQISSVCLTHLDHDHFTPTWLKTLVRCGIRVFCHNTRIDELQSRVNYHRHASEFADLVEPFDG